MLDTTKRGMKTKFVLNDHANKSFELLKKKISTLVLVLPRFEKLLTIECDASNVEIGVVLSQEGKPVSFHFENLSEAKRKYSIGHKGSS